MKIIHPTYNYSHDDAKRQLARFVMLDNPKSYVFDAYHAHEYNEILVFLKGGGTHNINLKSHVIKDNSLHLLAANNVHWVERSIYSNGFAIVYKEQFLEKLQYINPNIDFHNFYANSRIINLNMEQDEQCFKYIFQELLMNKSNDVYMLHLIGTFLSKIAIMEMALPIQAKECSSLITDIAVLIDIHYKKHLRLEQYATLLNITPRTLHAHISHASGKSLSCLQQDRILREAKKMLCTSEMNIGEIAFDLGFKATAHFTNWFKKQTGCLPSAYKCEV